MENLLEKFSLRELLKTFLPGVFFVTFCIPICEKLFPELTQINIYSVVIFILCSFLSSQIISGLDIPKRFCLFKKLLPTERVKKKCPNITSLCIYDAYYTYYEQLSDKSKDITDKYTTYYHSCVNIAIISILHIIVYFVVYKESFFQKPYGFYFLIVLVMSIVSILFLLYGYQKIQYRFNKDYDGFISSEQYKSINE